MYQGLTVICESVTICHVIVSPMAGDRSVSQGRQISVVVPTVSYFRVDCTISRVTLLTVCTLHCCTFIIFISYNVLMLSTLLNRVCTLDFSI